MPEPGKVTEEFELVLRAARSEPSTKPSAGFDWDRAIAIASSHGVIAALDEALETQSAVPAAVRSRLRMRRQRDAARNTLLAHELLRLRGLLETAGIVTLAYKGPALAVMIYGDLSRRHCSDLDILVRRADVTAAKAILLQAGYHSILTPREEDYHLRRRYHLHLKANESNLRVEIHWNLTPGYWPFPVSETRLWNHARHIRLLNSVIALPDPECTLLALCAHGAKEGWPRLCQIRDVAQLIATHPDLDWDWVREEARRIDRQPVLELGLSLAGSILGAGVPVRDSAGLRAVTRAFYDSKPLTGFRFYRYACGVWRRPRDIAGFLAYVAKRLPARLASLAAPSAADIESVAVPRSLGLLYYAVRPVRALIRYRSPRIMLNKILDNL